MTEPWALIRNPKSSSGKGEKRWPGIKAELEKQGIPFNEYVTQKPLHAIELVQTAIAKGARRILAVGGDGTVNEIANGIFTQTEVPFDAFLLAQIPIGTGNDRGRTIGIPRKMQDAIAQVKAGTEFTQDVGVVRWSEKGEEKQRYFLNMAGMGYDAFVGLAANERKARGKGSVMGYIIDLVRCLRNYDALPAGFDLDGKKLDERPIFSLTIGICEYNGGGMKQCPGASPNDGILDLTIGNNISKFKIVRNIPKLFSGSFVKLKEVEQHRAKKIVVSTVPEMLLEVDGENIGAGNAEFSIAPFQLRVVGTGPKK